MSSAEAFVPFDPEFEDRVRASFDRQVMMATLGVVLLRVSPGETELEMPFSDRLTQQHGFLHGGAVATLLDSACGYAALTLAPKEAAVLTAEYKVNLLAPASGPWFVARANVLKPGRTLTVVRGDAFARTESGEKLIATMLATIMTIEQSKLRG